MGITMVSQELQQFSIETFLEKPKEYLEKLEITYF